MLVTYFSYRQITLSRFTEKLNVNIRVIFHTGNLLWAGSSVLPAAPSIHGDSPAMQTFAIRVHLYVAVATWARPIVEGFVRFEPLTSMPPRARLAGVGFPWEEACEKEIWAMKLVLTFETEIKSHSVTINVELFVMLCKVVLTFESVDEILKCDHSNESYWAVLSCGAVYYSVQGGSNCWVCGWNPKVWPFK